MMETPVSVCPVPAEQQPLNEYQELKDSWSFRWVTLELGGYIKKLAWIWGLGWFVAGPMAAASFAPGKYPTKFILMGAAGASLGVVLALVRLYLGWSYVRSRLENQQVFYEESGWYDGQCWTKPEEILTRDRLIVTYQVQPILQRLQRTFVLLALFFFAGSLTWYFL